LIESKGNESPIKINNPNFPIEGAKSYFSGGGGLSSTAYDYWRFTQMLLNNGELEGIRLLSRKSVELMESPRTDVDKDGKPDLGLTLGIINDIGKMGELGTNESFFGAGAFYGMYWIDPKEDLTAVFMSQVLPSNTNVALKFHTMVYQALK
jgi:CubicO group peptidase (beta-lactamase class C family)